MDVLVLSFPCVISENQKFYAEVERQTNWDLTIAAPPSWKTGFDETRTLTRSPDFDGELVPIPVWFSGHIPLHLYKSFFTSLLRQRDPDAIYVHHEAYGLATAQLYVANWLTSQAPIGFYSAQNIEKAYPPPISWLEQFVYGESDFAFPITDTVEGVLRSKGYTGSTTTVPIGIDETLYNPDDAVRREEVGLPDDSVVLGYVGRMVEEKGLHTLLRALTHVRDLPWHLALFGSGPYEETVRTLSDSLGLSDRISHFGYVPHMEIPPYLATLDLLVVPSETQSDWEEQFGRVIIEGLACETSILGSDSGYIPTLIEKTGGGMVFPEADPHACADRLRTLITNAERRRTLARRGRRAVLDRYTNGAVASKFAAAVEEAVERERT